ncbi:MAG: N-acetylmuramic acid 6-phosphate etherase [Chloroflexi bacterium]|nr:N-acetylmuramic acid 6-phosphate etherase [Chloroflexota bacterium]
MPSHSDLTERRNPRFNALDRIAVQDALQLINEEDQKVALAVQQAIPAIAEAVEHATRRLRDGGRMFYIGAGTSGRLGVLDAVECVPTFSTSPTLVQAIIAGGNRALLQSIEGAEDDRRGSTEELAKRGFSGEDVLVGIAASGRTPYTVGAVERAREVGALSIGIACNEPSPLLDLSDIAIAVLVGPEVIAGSTRLKSGTAQKMVLNMLSTMTMVQLGKVYRNQMVDVQITNQKLAQRALQLTMDLLDLDEASASQLLAEARNHVKTAIVMKRCAVDWEEAQLLLARADDFLWRALDETVISGAK